MSSALDGRLASSLARVALQNIGREYPNKLGHVMNDESELCTPRALHPSFYGSYDWHSSVHMHWTLAHLLRVQPGLPEAAAIHAAFDEHLTEQNIAAELSYLRQPSRQSFERTYGWAWLLKLHGDLVTLAARDTDARRWRDALQPLAHAFVDRYLEFLPRTQYPIRAGTHANSAFGLLLPLDYAAIVGNQELTTCVQQKAEHWFGADRSYPACYEPGGDDFLSAGLVEAALMSRVLGERFAAWWRHFCPSQDELEVWLHPVHPSDRSDPKLAHLDGLNLSRAWCWKMLLVHLPSDLRPRAEETIRAHLTAALPHATNGDYVGTHWLASFALLALVDN